MMRVRETLGRAVRHPRGRRALVVSTAAIVVAIAAVLAGYWIHRAWLVLAVPAWIVLVVAAARALAFGQPEPDAVHAVPSPRHRH